jgi:hypothetical protein
MSKGKQRFTRTETMRLVKAVTDTGQKLGRIELENGKLVLEVIHPAEKDEWADWKPAA